MAGSYSSRISKYRNNAYTFYPLISSVYNIETKTCMLSSSKRGYIETIIRTMTNCGYSLAAACGAAGNLYIETRFNQWQDSTLPWDGRVDHYYGICQWYQGRITNLKNWCSQKNLDVTKFDSQLAFMIYELNSYLPRMKDGNGKNYKEFVNPCFAAKIFADKFEVCADKVKPQRENCAAYFYEIANTNFAWNSQIDFDWEHTFNNGNTVDTPYGSGVVNYTGGSGSGYGNEQGEDFKPMTEDALNVDITSSYSEDELWSEMFETDYENQFDESYFEKNDAIKNTYAKADEEFIRQMSNTEQPTPEESTGPGTQEVLVQSSISQSEHGEDFKPMTENYYENGEDDANDRYQENDWSFASGETDFASNDGF